MYKKTLSLTVALFLILAGYIPSVSAVPITVPNPDEIIIASIGMPETVDGHWCYDTASAELIQNVYGTLIFFDVDRAADPSVAGLVDSFIGDIAESWVISAPPDAGAPVGTDNTYYFKIREGIPWQDGAYGTVTPADVEYSFERWMVMDRLGGPSWMIYEPLLGVYHANLSDPDWGVKIDNAVQRNATHVWFNLVMSYPPFMKIVAQSWAGILCRDWAIAQGCWNASWAHWMEYHDPTVSPLDNPARVMMGSGPYSLDYIDYITQKWSITRFVGYWGGWPAAGCAGYAERCTYLDISTWAGRKILFLSNDPAAQADLVYVPRVNTPELEDPVGSGNAVAGVRYWKDLPVLSLSVVFFNFHIPTEGEFPGHGSPYIGNGLFSEFGVPWDFFQDENVRYGFAHAFDYDTYISNGYLGEAEQPATPLLRGVGFDDLHAAENEALKYAYDLTLAEYYLRQAWPNRVAEDGGGTVGLWDTGFAFTITTIIGSLPSPLLDAYMSFKADLESLNPKFHVSLLEVDFPTFLDDLVNPPIYKTKMLLYNLGWLADYPDPHDFFFPFMHTYGDFTLFQSYSNPAVDALIDAEMATNDRATRYGIFEELMQAYHDDLPSIPLVQPHARHYERTWLRGWYYNPIHPGPYLYHLWKSDEGLNEIGVWRGDVNGRANSGCVNILDAGFLSSKWTAVGNPYDARADINQDASVGILDAGAVSGSWGQTPMNP